MNEKLTRENPYGNIRPSIGVVALAVIIMLLPIPQDEMTLRTLVKLAVAQRESVVVVGNSAIDHSSICDRDARSIPVMVTADKSPVIDLSYPGQQLGQMVNIAAAALRSSSVKSVVVPVSLFQFGSYPTGDVRSQLFFRALSGKFSSNDVANELSTRTGLAAKLSQEFTAFSYKGREYPDIEGVKLRYFLPEQQASTCPESIGRDRRFIEAYHWNNYLRLPLRPAYVTDLVTLLDQARARRKTLRILLLPVNYDDMRVLDPLLANAVALRARELVLDLRTRGVDIIDSSSGLPATSFADRWCACGHLQQNGRLRVAASITASLK